MSRRRVVQQACRNKTVLSLTLSQSERLLLRSNRTRDLHILECRRIVLGQLPVAWQYSHLHKFSSNPNALVAGGCYRAAQDIKETSSHRMVGCRRLGWHPTTQRRLQTLFHRVDSCEPRESGESGVRAAPKPRGGG